MEKTAFRIGPGDPCHLGIRESDGRVWFAVPVPGGKEASLLLYRVGEKDPCAEFALPEEQRTGCVSSISVELPEPEKYEYNYCVDGVRKADPYARAVRRQPARQQTEPRCSLNLQFGVKTASLSLPYENSIFYKLHVKGFTAEKPSGVRHPGTFAGIEERIPYLKKLGITSVIVMPVYEFAEDQDVESCYELDSRIRVMHPKTERKKNYWGYTKGLYFAPKQSYAASGDANREFASLVDALHTAGLEIIPEFYFEAGEDPRFVTDVLRYWLLRFHVDGFHLIGTGTWIHAAVTDALLKKTKLICSGSGNLSAAPVNPITKNLAVADAGYEHLMRKFLKGDLDVTADDTAWYLRRNTDQAAFVNYFADQDGFTMYDMVSYEEKHNLANGEDGRDGTDENCSWNCGEEGPTKKAKIRALRERQLRNAFLMLLTSQGSPMIYAGDEAENSQGGNNNAWCQDNRTGWVTWSKTRGAGRLLEFVKNCIAFRMEHPVLRQKNPVRMSDYRGCGFPDLSYHSQVAWMNGTGQTKVGLGVMYCGNYAEKADGQADDTIYIAYNMYWQPQIFALPCLPDGIWTIKADTSGEGVFYPDGQEKAVPEETEKSVLVQPRSILVLIAKKAQE